MPMARIHVHVHVHGYIACHFECSCATTCPVDVPFSTMSIGSPRSLMRTGRCAVGFAHPGPANGVLLGGVRRTNASGHTLWEPSVGATAAVRRLQTPGSRLVLSGGALVRSNRENSPHASCLKSPGIEELHDVRAAAHATKTTSCRAMKRVCAGILFKISTHVWCPSSPLSLHFLAAPLPVWGSSSRPRRTG